MNRKKNFFRLILLFLFIGFVFPLFAQERKDVAVVAPPDFFDALAPWIAYRQAQGYTVHLLDSLFSEGEKASTDPIRPAAIRNRLAALAETTPLRAVLLVGDGAPVDGRSDGWRRVVPAPRVPSRVIKEFGGEESIASDSWYADFDGDNIPEIAVGRLPVRTPEELADTIRKIIRYEKETPPGDWQRQIRLIAGVGGFSPIVDSVIDRSVRKMLAETLPGGLDLSLAQANWRSPFCPDPELFRYTAVDQMNQGPLFWVYLGHGSHRGLDRLRITFPLMENGERPMPPGVEYGIMEIEDVEHVECRTSAPILLFCACYTGAYDAREDSIAERLAVRPRGPIAVVASSRLSMPYGMAVFGVELIQEIFGDERDPSEETPSLGEFILAAKRRMILGEQREQPTPDGQQTEIPAETSRERVRRMLDEMAKMFDPSAARLDEQLLDHVNLFNLFGDPLLRIRLPDRLTFNAPEEIAAGETISISDLFDNSSYFHGVSWSPEPASPPEYLVELVMPPERRTVKTPKRESYSMTDAERLDYQETFEAANRRVAASATFRNVGSGPLELTIPAGLTEKYILRVTRHAQGQETAVGSRRVTIRSERKSSAAK